MGLLQTFKQIEQRITLNESLYILINFNKLKNNVFQIFLYLYEEKNMLIQEVSQY